MNRMQITRPHTAKDITKPGSISKRKYLIDAEGNFRYEQIGEGGYLEMEEKIRIFLHGIGVMNWEVLTVFKGNETIDNDGLRCFCVVHISGMKEKTMSGHTGDNLIDRSRVDLQVSCYLSVGHATDSFHKHFFDQVWPFQPIGNAECLGTERSFA